MKPKQPPFDWNKHALDMRGHSITVEGAWVRICCQLNAVNPRGTIAEDIEYWSNLINRDETKTNDIIKYLDIKGIADVNRNGNGIITIACRRMLKEEKEKELNRLKGQRFRKQQKETEDERRKRAVMAIPLKTQGEYYYIVKSDIVEWQDLYPGVDIMEQLRECKKWNDKNPNRRKTKQGIRKHIMFFFDSEYNQLKMFAKKEEKEICPQCGLPIHMKIGGICQKCYDINQR